MKEISDDKIIGLLMADIESIAREFYTEEIALVLHSTDEDAPGLDEIIDQVSVGQLGIGGQEITRYKTDLEQAEQGVNRAKRFVARMVAEIERWTSEHSDFLRDLITGELAEEGFASDVERVRRLAGLLERKQDAFPSIMLAVYTLGPGWGEVFLKMKLRKIRKFVRKHRKLLGIFLLAYLVLPILCTGVAYAQAIPVPTIEIGVGDASNPEDVSIGLQVILLLTLLTLAPSILIMMTSFTRIIIVLSLTRSALGTQQMPPNQVLIGLALFLTFFVMAPVLGNINEQALQPYMAGDITFQEGLKKAEAPLRDFLFKQTRKKDLALFVDIAGMDKPVTMDDVPTWVLIPAFIISELKTAFQMGFVIYIPFLIIDMVVASTLMSMGMLMLPPIIISLPFKILLFILVDGWYLITRSMVLSFNF